MEPKPGSYLFQPWSEEGRITNLTINDDGSRYIQNHIYQNLKFYFWRISNPRMGC